jgi:hypothetical protein
MRLVCPFCGDPRRLKIAQVAGMVAFVLLCLSTATVP